MKDADVSNNDNVDDRTVAVCPSFNAYYSDRQATAARAVNEVLASRSGSPRSELDEDEFGFATGRFDEDDDEFEFSILGNESFPDGQIYPIFDRELIGEAAVDAASVSLKKLFIDEARAESDSESEAEDELGSVASGAYCVWKLKTSPVQSPSPSRWKKSKSTGSSSKRWKLRDLLLRRSNSDGKESFVYLTTASSGASSSSNSTEVAVVKSNVVKVKPGMRKGSEHNKSAHEMFYVEKRAVKEEDKKKSYLPYRKGLVGFGFFPNGVGVTNNFRPF